MHRRRRQEFTMKNTNLNVETTRRAIIAGLGTGIAATLLGAPRLAFGAPAQELSDGDILTFALNLEYLEAEFYAMAANGSALPATDTRGTGAAGRTQGGKRVNFENKQLENLAKEIAEDERKHVEFLRKALAGAAIAKPVINLDALGVGFRDENEFIVVARALEDVGVSAYRGAARLIQNKDYLDAAAGILSTEAYHAGHLRSHAIYAGLEQKALDAKDQPATDTNWNPTDENGIVVGRTPAEVGAIVRGAQASGGAFFPRGLNGKIR
ncbi:ferritin-like domain-containing protein [bacterium]|nr:MAG: ferritin-like domain-containing protein [bacterium]